MQRELMTSRLRVPEPPSRPGRAADFSHLNLSLAGAIGRPDPEAPVVNATEISQGLIRVLDDNGKAVGPWDPCLGRDLLLRGLRAMMLTRAFDERMFRAQRQGKISFYIKSTGEEATAVAAALALRPDDMLFPSYRQQGLLIARDVPLLEMVCQLYSNSRDPVKGRQMPIFYSRRASGLFTLSGNLATQLIQSVGWAMAAAYKADSRIAATWTGEGAASEPDFHHAMTFAAVYTAPVLINIVNNQWGISTHQNLSGAEHATFASRAAGFGIPGLRVDGNDFLAVYAAADWAAKRARAGLGATLIELLSYRAESHSTSDDPNRYRAADEWKNWPLGDPIRRLRAHLIGIGAWSEAAHAGLETELQETVRATAKEAERFGTLQTGPRLPVSTMFQDVFKEMTWNLQRQCAEAEAIASKGH